jgi:DNA-binding response OmpR family regulator
MDGPINILLVEDDADLGPTLNRALSSSGHCVTLVTSIEAALRSFAKNKTFHIMLLDLQVGDERGESLIEQLHIEHKSIPPVIIMSAQPAYEISSTARWINAATVLRKPCAVQEIESTIQRVLG